MKTAGIILLAAILIFLLYKPFLRLKDKLEARKVIKLSARRKAFKRKRPSKGKCSLCHQKSGRLSFYAAENGSVIGVCDKCRPIAERRALLRL